MIECWDGFFGKKLPVEFNLPSSEWPIDGFPAWVVIESVDHLMVRMRSAFGGDSILVNMSVIKTIGSPIDES